MEYNHPYLKDSHHNHTDKIYHVISNSLNLTIDGPTLIHLSDNGDVTHQFPINTSEVFTSPKLLFLFSENIKRKISPIIKDDEESIRFRAANESILSSFDLFNESFDSLLDEPATPSKKDAELSKSYEKKELKEKTFDDLFEEQAFNIPHDLQQQIEELFGVENVEVMGRVNSQKGKIEEAASGTIYIENVDKLTPDVQLILLELLKSHSYFSLGGYELKKLNTRVIVSSLLDPADLLHRSNFSPHLYYHLAGLSIHLPPLRKRKRDILLLAEHFLKDFCTKNGLVNKVLTAQARRKLLNYFYPGNIRELRTIIDLAVVLSNDEKVDQAHISFTSVEEELLLEGEELTMREYNDVILRHFLKKYNNVMTVAEKLEIGKSSIYNFLKRERDEEGQ